MAYPESYRYTREHVWVHLEGDNATVGITLHALHNLGDIVYVDLPRIGARVEAGKRLGSTESLREMFEVHAPISGDVIEVNEALASSPEKLNEDPHGAAWMVKLRIEKGAEFGNLLSAGEYQAYAGSES